MDTERNPQEIKKAGWLAPSVLSARTSYSQWECVVLCAIYYCIFLTLLGGRGIHYPHREATGNGKASRGHHRETKRNHKEHPIAIIRKSNGFNRQSLGTNRKSIAMNGHRKESTGNQKGWMACAINSERTNVLLPVGARCPLCHLLLYFSDPVGGEGNSLPTQGSNRKWKGFTGTSKGNQKEPQGTPIESSGNQMVSTGNH